MTQGNVNPIDVREITEVIYEHNATAAYAKMVVREQAATWEGNKHDCKQAVVNQRAQVATLAGALRTEVGE